MKYNDFEISPKGIHDILLRVGSACKKDYEDKIQKIRSAKWRYIDETGIKVNGENRWLWIFRTDTNETLVVIRKSRGSKVLEKYSVKDIKELILQMDGGLIAGLTNFSDAGHIYYVRSIISLILRKMENDCLMKFMRVSKS